MLQLFSQEYRIQRPVRTFDLTLVKKSLLSSSDIQKRTASKPTIRFASRFVNLDSAGTHRIEVRLLPASFNT